MTRLAIGLQLSSFLSLIIISFLNCPAAAITCFKCKSMDNSNFGCSDPFDTGRKLERRECPPYERCAKIQGVNMQGQSFIIRDCYKTNYEPRSSAYRDKRIAYYHDMVDGEISICNVNLCNSSLRLASCLNCVNYIILIVVIIAILF